MRLVLVYGQCGTVWFGVMGHLYRQVCQGMVHLSTSSEVRVADVVALVWSDCYVTSIHLGRWNMYDMQLVLSYMVTRCNGVPSL